jgi:hypothetical protein
MAFPCQSQDDSSLPPRHRHQQPKACAQPAAANEAAAPEGPLVLLAAEPFGPVAFAVQRLQAREHHSPPDSPPPVPLTLSSSIATDIGANAAIYTLPDSIKLSYGDHLRA